MHSTLSIIGTGVYLPPSQSIRELVSEAGGDMGDYNDWPNACVAKEEDHPSSMGATALHRALAAANITADNLDYIFSVGMSRDYQPSWSLAAEWARLSGAPSTCIPLDLTSGCAGTLFGLDMLLSHLAVRGGGYAAIVAAERTSHTLERGNPENSKLWGFGDAAGALIVSMNRSEQARVIFRGAEFTSSSELNGAVIIKYGGTKHPVAPQGVNPAKRKLQLPEGFELSAAYRVGYSKVLNAMKQRFDVDPDTLIVNQISVNIVQMIGEIAGVSPDNITITGNDFGHCGSADIIIGLDKRLSAGNIKSPISIAASTPYLFGAGLLDAG